MTPRRSPRSDRPVIYDGRRHADRSCPRDYFDARELRGKTRTAARGRAWMSAPRHAIDSSIDSSIQLSSRAGIMRPLLSRAASSEAPLMSLADLKDSGWMEHHSTSNGSDGTSPRTEVYYFILIDDRASRIRRVNNNPHARLFRL